MLTATDDEEPGGTDEHDEEADVDTSDSPSKRWPRFNPHLRANPRSKVLVRQIAALAAHLDAIQMDRRKARSPKEARTFRLAVEALACNLLAMTLVRPELRMTITTAHAAMSGPFAPAIYGRAFPTLVDLMASDDVGIIERDRSFQFGAVGARGRSVRPGTRLADHLPVGAIAFSDFRQEVATDLLFLRGRKVKGAAPFLPIPETDRTAQLRAEMKRLNSWFAKARIDLLDDDGVHTALPFNRTVRRYFNNGNFMEGGRLFGGFWMGMPREDRFRLIRVDGEEIANVDFGQLFPRLAYVYARQDPGERDIYDIDGIDPKHRKGLKKLMNAALFAKTPLKNWPRETAHLFPEGMKVKTALDAIKARHPAIAPLFSTAAGYRCMFAESTMLVHALARLFRQGITALPVHDSVIVARSRAEEAKAILQRTMLDHVGVPQTPVSIELDAG